jgi:hypothetical protein
MVVNATMVAMAAHYGEETQVIYHVTSGHQNPLKFHLLVESMYDNLFNNPRVRGDKRTINHKRLVLFNRYPYFHAYMALVYKMPLQVHTWHFFCFEGLFVIELYFPINTLSITMRSKYLVVSRCCTWWTFYSVGCSQSSTISLTETAISWCIWPSSIPHLPYSRDGEIWEKYSIFSK